MVDSVTVESRESWGSRLGDSLKGVCCGLVMILISVVVIIWNESNTVEMHRAYSEGAKVITSLSSADTVNAEYDNTLVHVSGTAIPGSYIEDGTFGVTQDDILKLRRNALMYQWVETEDRETTKHTGGSTTTRTTYDYHKEWKSYRVDSSSFQSSSDHTNPYMMFEAYGVVADPITLGVFTLNNEATYNHMNWYEEISTSLSVDNIPDDGNEYYATTYQGSYGKGYYFSKNGSSSQSSPEVGDMIVTFEVVPSQTIAIIAKQTDYMLSYYETSNGRDLLLIEPGSPSATQMFAHAHRAATIQAFLIRLAGFILLWIALSMIMKPISVFADVLPTLGNCVEGINCWVSGIIAFTASITLIAISWIAVRPILSIFILGLIGGIAFFLYKRQKTVASNDEPSTIAYHDIMEGGAPNKAMESLGAVTSMPTLPQLYYSGGGNFATGQPVTVQGVAPTAPPVYYGANTTTGPAQGVAPTAAPPIYYSGGGNVATGPPVTAQGVAPSAPPVYHGGGADDIVTGNAPAAASAYHDTMSNPIPVVTATVVGVPVQGGDSISGSANA